MMTHTPRTLTPAEIAARQFRANTAKVGNSGPKPYPDHARRAFGKQKNTVPPINLTDVMRKAKADPEYRRVVNAALLAGKVTFGS